ncbi:MAG: HEAT repeat domain-containing protein, partial [Flavobacteriales bacterium]|nr:HEAT repeat domain-containing protein [Flavobacteriales bacterium]
MRALGISIVLLALCGCGHRGASTLSKWNDERLWPVLSAQDRRATSDLCAFLEDSSALIREAAAMAFASVQDSAAIPCLLRALGDAEPSVRAAAAFALGFVADSTTVVRMAERAMIEPDSAVQRAHLRASFIAMQRIGMLKDPHALLYLLSRSSGHDGVRVADALRRLPVDTLRAIQDEYFELLGLRTHEERILLVTGLKHFPTDLMLHRMAVENPRQEIRVSALRAIAARNDTSELWMLVDALSDVDRSVRLTALEQLQRWQGPLPGRELWALARNMEDTTMMIPLCGLVMQHGEGDMREACATLLADLARHDLGPYLNAALITARRNDLPLDTLILWMTAIRSAPERQASFAAALELVRETMARSRYTTLEAQYAPLKDVIGTALASRDAGLIAAAAERLAGEDGGTIALLMDPNSERQAMAALLPVRDLEARLLLAQVIARRDGNAVPVREEITYNHPISFEDLRRIEQGRQYRIITNKGVIDLALEPDAAPGSCVFFDSLVTTGY